MHPIKIRLVSATRKTRKDFFDNAALGKSLRLYQNMPGWQLCLFPENAQPLPVVYNKAIAACADEPSLLAFIHDDVYLNDFFWHQRIAEGLQTFDVLGVAGNRRRAPNQPSWAFVDDRFTWDAKGNLSGCVAHGTGFPSKNLSFFGVSGQPCKLLDGLLLVADSAVLHRTGLRFDPQFAFHFYDLDFCRQAELRGLRMGTWPIALIHESGGAFGSPAWRSAYRAYMEKYRHDP